MRVQGSLAFPHSLGIYYTALSQYLGFWKFGDEYKVMGLAAYGEPAYLEEFRRIVTNDGPDFRLGLDDSSHHRRGAEMSWREADKTPVLGRLFSEYLERRLGPARAPESPLERKHKNIAASLQARLEEVLFQRVARPPLNRPAPQGALPRRRRGIQLRRQRKDLRTLRPSKRSSYSPQRAMQASHWAPPFMFGMRFSAGPAVSKCGMPRGVPIPRFGNSPSDGRAASIRSRPSHLRIAG